MIVVKEDEMLMDFFIKRNKFKKVTCSARVPFNGKVNSVMVQRVNVQVFIIQGGLVQHP